MINSNNSTFSMMNAEQHFSSKTFSSTSFSASNASSIFHTASDRINNSQFDDVNTLPTDFEELTITSPGTTTIACRTPKESFETRLPSGFNSNIPDDFFKFNQSGFKNGQPEGIFTKSFKTSQPENKFGGFQTQPGNEKVVSLLKNPTDFENRLQTRMSCGLKNNPDPDMLRSFNQRSFGDRHENMSEIPRNLFNNEMPANLSFSQTQSSQYTKAQATRTVCSKVVRKRIKRTIVNGKVVEEEEEVDEIEDEPTTEQVTFENCSNSTKKEVNINGKKFFWTRHSRNPSADKFLDGNNDTAEVRNKPKAIAAPQKKTTKLMSVLGIGKKKNAGKTEPIINELLETEENYVKDLNLVVEDFMPELLRPDAPKELTGDNQHRLFGNVEIICMFHDAQFRPDLRECEKTPEDIANCFLKHRREFSLYRHYNRNKPKSDMYLNKYGSFFKEKQDQLQLSLGLQSFLIKPTQRLMRYTLLMQELAKECKKQSIPADEVKAVIEMLAAETRLGNDLMALDAIKNCEMDLKDQGDLIYRDAFTVRKGTEPGYKAMVFLFEKIMLFTKRVLENNIDVLYYQDFIYLKDIGLTECEKEHKIFKVWFHKHTLKPYTLETNDKKVKERWVSEIRKQLENELERTKREHTARPRTFIDLQNSEK